MNKTILHICLLMIFIKTCNSIALIPDPQNSLVDQFPYKIEKSKITFSFYFSTNSVGIYYGQNFGIQFPEYEYPFNFLKPNSYNCKLSDSNGKEYRVDAVNSVASPLDPLSTPESHIAYCKFTDTNTPKLKVGSNILYRLEFGLNDDSINFTSFFPQIQIFTSTINHKDKIIIDSTSIGSLVQQETYKKPEYAKLEISNSELIPITGTCSEEVSKCKFVYPYDKFNLKFTLTSNWVLETIQNVIIIIKLPYESIDVSNISLISTGIKGESLSDPNLNTKELIKSKENDPETYLSALPGKSLKLEKISEGKYFIDNIGENLYIGRKFILILTGFIAKDNTINQSQNLEVLVNWRNTYSVLSYDSKPIIKINQANIFYNGKQNMTGINHPEYWDLYENSAWPLKFTFSVNSNLSNGGYVLIRHTNTQENVSKINFIASTCEFGENLNLNKEIDNSFNKKPICFPLVLDFDYKDFDSSEPYNGSGIYFKLDNIKKNINYTFTVWVYADSCGSFSSILINPDPTSGNSNSFTKWQFTYTIYKDIDQTKLYEEVFDNQIILAKSSPILFNNICWGALLLHKQTALVERYKSITNYPGNLSPKDILLFKEEFDFEFGTIPDAIENCKDCILQDVNAYSFPNSFLFSSLSSTASTDSNFLIKVNVDKSTFEPYNNNDEFDLIGASFIPLPVYIKDSEFYFLKGRLNVQFSSQFHKPGKSLNECYLSWANTKNINTSSVSQTSLLPIYNEEKFSGLNKGNFIKGNSCNTGSLDSIKSNVFSSLTKSDNEVLDTEPLPFHIMSENNNVSTSNAKEQVGWTFLLDSLNKSTNRSYNKYHFMIYSNCLRTKNPSEIKIKSIFTYYDVQIQWLIQKISSTEYVPNRVIRMIKLLPEGGIFNNWEKFVEYEPEPVKFHYAFGSDTKNNSVCLIEVSGQSLSSLLGETNTLILFMNDINLLETDRKTLNASYPIAPLVSNIKSYGFSSQITKTSKNFYVSESDNPTILEYMVKDFNKNILPKSSYHIIFGSMIIITEISGVNVTSERSYQPNLLIPIYCPIVVKKQPLSNLIGTGLVSLFIASTNITGKDVSNLSPFNKILLDSTETLKAYQGNISKNESSTTDKIQSTLRFRAYNFKNEKNNSLYVLNGTLKDSGKTANCSGLTLFLNESIVIQEEELQIVYKNKLGVEEKYNPYLYYQPNSLFYIFGKPFSKALLFTSNKNFELTKNTISIQQPQDPNINSAYLKYIGIERPPIQNLNEKGFIDLIGFSCVSYDSKIISSLTNYIYSTSSLQSTNVLNFYGFIIDFTNDDSKWNIIIDKDSDSTQDPVYKEDKTSNINLKISLPLYLPKNSEIVFGAYDQNTFNSSNVLKNLKDNTLCALNNSFKEIDDVCLLYKENSNFKISCKIPLEFDLSINTDVSICCYNIEYRSDNKFTITSLQANTNLDSKYDDFISKSVSNPQISFNISNETNYLYYKEIQPDVNQPLSSIEFAKLNRIAYTFVEQHNSYGFAILEVVIPKEPIKNMLIEIKGDFSLLNIIGVKPICLPFFEKFENYQNNKNNPNKFSENLRFVSGCFLNKLSDTNNVIKISTKKVIFKCSTKVYFGKSLLVIIGPIKEIDFSLGAYVGKTFEVLMKSLAGDGDEILTKQGPTQIVNINKKLKDSPFRTNVTNLCPIVSIFPKIVDSYSEITIQVNLENDIKSGLDTAKAKGLIANELALFFTDPEDFSLDNKNISVYEDGKLVNYNINEFSVMMISTTFDPSISTSKKYSIVGLTNKYIKVGKTLGCTINNFNNNTKERFNLITGNGEIAGLPLIFKTNIPNMQGHLKILNDTESNQLNLDEKDLPRRSSDFRIKIIPDYSLGMIVYPFVIKNNPFIVITFQNYYYMQFYNYNSTSQNVLLKEWVSTSKSETVENSVQPEIKEIRFIGNQIIISLVNSEWTFPINFLYWEIVIKNIKNPQDTILSAAVNVSIYNQDYTAIFKMYTNFINSSWSKLQNSYFDLIKFSKGRKFDYNFNKISVIDIIDDNSSIVNTINLSQGIFKKAYFVKRKFLIPILLLENNETTISLKNDANIASTSEKSYIFYLFSEVKVYFNIAVKCETPDGTYMIDFNSSNKNYPLSIVFLNVEKNEVGEIKLYYDSTLLKEVKSTIIIPIGGSIFFFYRLNKSSNEDLTLGWKSKSIGDNVRSVINPTKISKTSFTGKSKISATIGKKSDTIEEFSISQPSSCFSVIPNQVNITYIGEPQNITNKDFSSNFSIVENMQFDTYNSLTFKFFSTIFPLHVSCVLFCENKSFTSDNLNLLYDPLPFENLEFLVQYYYGYYLEEKDMKINFSNLERGRGYKLTCQVNSTADALLNSNQANYQLSDNLYNLFTFTENTENKLKTKSSIDENCIYAIDFYKKSENDTISYPIDDAFLNITISTLQIQFNKSDNSNGCLVVQGPNNKFDNYIKYNLSPICKSTTTTTGIDDKLNSNIVPTLYKSNGNYVKFCVLPTINCPVNINQDRILQILKSFTLDENNLYKSYGLNIALEILDGEPYNYSINISNFDITPHNTITFLASYPKIVKCKFSINLNSISEPITTDQIDNCNLETNYCGEFETGIHGSKVSIKLKNVKQLNYYLWIYCFSNTKNYKYKTIPFFIRSISTNNYVQETDPDYLQQEDSANSEMPILDSSVNEMTSSTDSNSTTTTSELNSAVNISKVEDISNNSNSTKFFEFSLCLVLILAVLIIWFE